MIKELYLLRHADADTIAETDDARPLSPKGEAQARRVGRFCEAHEITDLKIFASPLPRAHQTAEIVARHLELDFIIAPWLRSGMRPPIAIEQLRAVADDEAVMIVGHEPDFSGLVAFLLGLPSGEHIEIRKASLTRLTIHALEKAGARLDFSLPCRLM